MSGVVGTRASRRHGSRAAAHDQVRSACSRAVPTNVFQARNISYMPSILNLAISVIYIDIMIDIRTFPLAALVCV